MDENQSVTTTAAAQSNREVPFPFEIRQIVAEEIEKRKRNDFECKFEIANEIIAYAVSIADETGQKVSSDLVFRAVLLACREMTI
jgi:hypothetical protein